VPPSAKAPATVARICDALRQSVKPERNTDDEITNHENVPFMLSARRGLDLGGRIPLLHRRHALTVTEAFLRSWPRTRCCFFPREGRSTNGPAPAQIIGARSIAGDAKNRRH
jgi:hypothetical protein